MRGVCRKQKEQARMMLGREDRALLEISRHGRTPELFTCLRTLFCSPHRKEGSERKLKFLLLRCVLWLFLIFTFTIISYSTYYEYHRISFIYIKSFSSSVSCFFSHKVLPFLWNSLLPLP